MGQITRQEPQLTWLTSGPWWHMLLKILTSVFVVLLSMFVAVTCILPCIKSMVQRMVTNAFIYYALAQEDEEKGMKDCVQIK